MAGRAAPHAITRLGGQAPTSGGAWNQILLDRGRQCHAFPSPCMDPVAIDMLRFVPSANRPDGNLSGGPGPPPIRKTSSRSGSIITSTHAKFQLLLLLHNDTNFQPFYNFQASGANVPGFGANVGSRYQQFNPSHTWTISNSLVNEFRFTYMREGQLTFQHPQVTGAVQDSCSSQQLRRSVSTERPTLRDQLASLRRLALIDQGRHYHRLASQSHRGSLR